MIWKWLYNKDFGILNLVFGTHVSWMGNPNFVFWSITIVMIWSGIGYNMIILLAGLQGISPSYYEAAEIDGAGPVAKFFKITLPLLSPTLFFVSITSIIGTLQSFDIVMMMLGKTSLVEGKATTAVYMFYKQAFILHNKGYAATIAIALFIVTMIITAIQLRLQKKWNID
jgi:multiple sugar transport system permease protein